MQSTEQVQVLQDKSGLYIGTLDENGRKEGVGLKLHFSKDQELIIAYWKDDMKDGKGVKLQSSGIGFCGSWTNDVVDIGGLYFWHDDSVQEVLLSSRGEGFYQRTYVNGNVESCFKSN